MHSFKQQNALKIGEGGAGKARETGEGRNASTTRNNKVTNT